MFYANYIREKIKNLPKYERIEGKSISIGNSLKRPLRNIRIWGESLQKRTPTAEAPVDITSVVNPTVEFCGKNLICNEVEGCPREIGPTSILNFDKCYFFTKYSPGGYGSAASIESWNGKPYTATTPQSYYGFGIMVPVKPNTTYCASFNIESTTRVYTSVANYIDGKHSSYKEIESGVPFITPDSVNGIILSFRTKTVGDVYTVSDIQLEEGDTATFYEQYIMPQTVDFCGTILEDIQLRGLKDKNGNFVARDEIVVDGKKRRVKLIQKCWEIVLDGSDSERWKVYDNISGFEGFAIYGEILPEQYTRRTPAFCNQCLVDYNAMWLGVDNKVIYWVGKEARRFYDPSLEDKGLVNLKVHLNENPLKIVSYYKNPIETDITQTDVGEMLLALHTNKETTKVFLNSESGLGDVQVRYVRK